MKTTFDTRTNPYPIGCDESLRFNAQKQMIDLLVAQAAQYNKFKRFTEEHATMQVVKSIAQMMEDEWMAEDG